ncbi:DMT family transporter [Pseudomonas sp. RP23018S]|uniref:DMT family transporter n=1 Tax=Pseudomonas sp. RP23018S TaxID=3096037 RepID=UPI002ACA17FD|nr:DMT family transporter [Pseudomonas sp. RP23018S]MDZ5601650.1 DMT family transporter [Pseudomonas sp. RP23018S]
MDRSVRRGSMEMVAAMLISGTIGWFVLISAQPVLSVVFWRCVFGSLALLAVCASLGQLRAGVMTRAVLGWAVLSGVAIVGNWLLLFAAYSRASIAIATAVYNLQPFLLVGLAGVFLGERVTLAKLTWLGVAFLGMLAIVAAHGEGQGSDYLLGISLAFGAALLYAVAALIIKRLRNTPAQVIALVQVVTGVLLLAPWVMPIALPAATPAIASLLTLGLVHTGVMYVLLYSAIQRLPTALTGALSFIYPVAAILVDWLAFGHRLGALQWLGVGLILLAAAGMQQGGWFAQAGTRASTR